MLCQFAFCKRHRLSPGSRAIFCESGENLYWKVVGAASFDLRRLTSKLTGPEQRDGICASVFAGTNAGTLCRVRLSDMLGLSHGVTDDGNLDIEQLRFQLCLHRRVQAVTCGVLLERVFDPTFD